MRTDEPLYTDFTELISDLFGKRHEIKLEGEVRRIFRKCLNIMIKHGATSVGSSGYQRGCDPMKKIKRNLKKLKPEIVGFHNNGIPGLFMIIEVLARGIFIGGNQNPHVSTLNHESHLWDQVEGTELAPVWYTGEIPDWKIWMSRNWICINTNGKNYVGDRDLLLLLHDTMAQRMNGLMSCSLAQSFGKTNYPTPDEMLWVTSMEDLLISRFESQGYALTSQHEALSVLSLFEIVPDPICSHVKFKDDLIETFRDFETKTEKWDATPWMNHFLSGLNSIGGKNPHKISQLFGLYKISGHPIVNPLDSIDKLTSVRSRRTSNPLYIKRLVCHFKELFATRYRLKNGRWPEMNVQQCRISNPVRIAVTHESGLMRRKKGYHLYNWDKVTFGKIFQIAQAIEITSLISDKTLSALGNELHESLEKRGTIGDSVDRSVIMAWLKTEMARPKQFFEAIDRDGFSEFEKVMAVRVKELEMKLNGRLFGMTTFPMRTYIVLTEALLKRLILKYFLEITMMENYIDLTQKIYEHP